MESIIDSSMRGDVMMETEAPIEIPTIPLLLKNSPGKGRGVYLNTDVSYGTLLHISPLLLIPSSQDSSSDNDDAPVERVVLSHYTYTFDKNTQAVALGMGSMFNHSKRNNVGFIIDKKNLLIRYISTCDISKGTELCINYGNHLWFEDSHSDDEEGFASNNSVDPFSVLDL